MAQHTRPLPSQRTPGLTLPPSLTSTPPARGDAPAPAPTREPRRETPPETPSDTSGEVRHLPVEPDAPGRPWYRSEPWLAVCLAAFVPLLIAIVAPAAAKMPLLAVGGALVVVGVGMLLRQERGSRAEPPASR
jgi:hypothetical protein